MNVKIALGALVSILLVGVLFFLIRKPPINTEKLPEKKIPEGQVYNVIENELNQAIENVSMEDIENALLK